MAYRSRWRFPVGAVGAAACALVFGLFCVRSNKIYFSMLTLAFAQIVWAICFKWNSVTGGEQGLSNVPYPDLGWMSAVPLLGDLRTADHYYLLVLLLVAIAFAALARITASPFGRVLTAIRENPERAEFVGINVRRYQLAAFTVAGAFAGFAGALFGLFNRGVFPDFAHWSKSAEVLIMAILGGMGHFWGPAVGRGDARAAQSADHVLHAILAAGAGHDPDRAAVCVSRRDRRRAACRASEIAEAARCLTCATSVNPSAVSRRSAA